jgi:hypothetical protein
LAQTPLQPPILKNSILKDLNEKKVNRSCHAAFRGTHCDGAKPFAKPRTIRYGSAGNGYS